jgi:hypothetical protein
VRKGFSLRTRNHWWNGEAITATPEDTLKKVAEAHGEVPLELLKMILAGEKQLR